MLLSKKQQLVIISGIVVFYIFILALFANWSILKYKKYIVFPPETSTTTVALVFGAGLNDDGTLGDLLFDRVAAAAALYKDGKVSLLMMTGDDGRVRQNEVKAMKEAAVDLGVPEEDVIIDPHGYRTYESCFRSSKVYGLRKVIAVSQAFHLPRVIYMCRNMGIDTVGVASDFREYKNKTFFTGMREVAARFKGWWQVSVTRPKARELSVK